MYDREGQVQKKKFLDNLFDSGLSSPTQSKEISDYKLPDLPIDEVFGFKVWMGTLLSFFFLSYVFSFNLLIIIPLIFLGLLIYSVITLGNKHLVDCVKMARKYIKMKYFSGNRGNKGCEVIEEGREYKLMEI
jgi:hypothetical protein